MNKGKVTRDGQTIDFTGKEPTISDREIQFGAQQIMDIMREFKSPKDAAMVFAWAHIHLIKTSFPPVFKPEAFRAIDGHAAAVKDILNDEWQ